MNFPLQNAKPFMQNGRTLVPIRFVSESVGATVDYELKYGIDMNIYYDT